MFRWALEWDAQAGKSSSQRSVACRLLSLFKQGRSSHAFLTWFGNQWAWQVSKKLGVGYRGRMHG